MEKKMTKEELRKHREIGLLEARERTRLMASLGWEDSVVSDVIKAWHTGRTTSER